jgi:hypothetical protein
MRGILTVIVTVSMVLTAIGAFANENDPQKTYWNPQGLPHFIMTNVRDQIWLKTDVSIGRARIVQLNDVCDNDGILFKHRCFDVYIAENAKRRCKVLIRKGFNIGGFDYVKCVSKTGEK